MKNSIIAAVAMSIVGIGAFTSTSQAGTRDSNYNSHNSGNTLYSGQMDTTKGMRKNTYSWECESRCHGRGNHADYRNWDDKSNYRSHQKHSRRHSESARIENPSKDDGEPKTRNDSTH